MGRISKGILGGFSGTVGTVVGGNWKGIEYMRSRAVIRNSNTTSQQIQRAKFGVVNKFLSPLRPLLGITFREFATKKTGQNSALSYTLKNAVHGIYPDLKIDYTRALVARGSLPNADSAAAVASTAGIVTFNWKDNTGMGDAKPDDKAILVVYCESLNHSRYTLAGGLRSAESATLSVPSFSGKEVQTWLAFIAQNGREIATSVHTGTLIVS